MRCIVCTDAGDLAEHDCRLPLSNLTLVLQDFNELDALPLEQLGSAAADPARLSARLGLDLPAEVCSAYCRLRMALAAVLPEAATDSQPVPPVLPPPIAQNGAAQNGAAPPPAQQQQQQQQQLNGEAAAPPAAAGSPPPQRLPWRRYGAGHSKRAAQYASDWLGRQLEAAEMHKAQLRWVLFGTCCPAALLHYRCPAVLPCAAAAAAVAAQCIAALVWGQAIWTSALCSLPCRVASAGCCRARHASVSLCLQPPCLCPFLRCCSRLSECLQRPGAAAFQDAARRLEDAQQQLATPSSGDAQLQQLEAALQRFILLQWLWFERMCGMYARQASVGGQRCRACFPAANKLIKLIAHNITRPS